MSVQNYTDQQIIERLPVCDGWRGLPDGILDVWVRSRADEFDRFDDKVYTFECKNGVAKFVMVCSGTSNAGAEGLKHYDKYNGLGCAVLNGNQIVYGSHAYGLHKGKYWAYRQVRDFPYYRDGDKDNRAEEIGVIQHGIIGANCHAAGWYSTYIGGWSVACLVRNVKAQFDAWMRFMAKRPLSVAILDEWTPQPSGRMLNEREATEIVDRFQESGHAEPGLLEIPPIEQPASPVAIPDESSAIEQPVEKPADPAPQPQFVAEDKMVDAPPKEGSTAAATNVTIAGITVPTVLVGVVTAIKSFIADGYISAAQVGEVVINFVSANQKFVFIGLGLIIGNMMLKKAYKQITLWLQMWFASRPDRHNVTVNPQ